MEYINKIKILVWGTGVDYSPNLIELLGTLMNKDLLGITRGGGIDIVGVTSNYKIKGSIDNIPFITKKEITDLDFDYIVVTPNEYFSQIVSEAARMGIEHNKIIRQDIVKLPGFNFAKYMELKKSRLSIISQNCFGGVLYNRFGLQFLSPTINMWTPRQSFLRMVNNLREYMNQKLQFREARFNPDEKLVYPLYALGDVEWHMNHYTNFDEAEKKWYERAKRINWNNLLIAMWTNSEEELEEFDSLPYDKKVCFTTFKSNKKSAFYIPPISNYKKFSRYLIGFAKGRFPLYDLWDLMLYGKKTPRMDFELM